MIDELFKKNNLKITKQRMEIINAVVKLKDNATLKNILDQVNLKMDRSTVYRILDILIKSNILGKQINSDNQDYYMVMSEHVHYIKCVHCKRVESLNICPFDVDAFKGYKLISHSVILNGICKDCQKNVC